MQRTIAVGKIPASGARRYVFVAFRAGSVLALAFEEADVKPSSICASFVGCGFFLLCSSAFAQSTAAQSPAFATSSAAGKDWSSSSQLGNYQTRANKSHLGIGLSMSGFIVGGRWEIANGGVLGLDVVWRRALNNRNRIEVGGLFRFSFTPDAALVGGGIPFRLVLGMSDRFETALGLELSYTRIYFNQPFFIPRNGFITTARWDIGYFVDPRLAIGITPIGFSVVAGGRVDPFVTYEPGIWARFSPI
jgi:hypothetical protein